jgi:F-type H+-transporting ATPase subunit gamma
MVEGTVNLQELRDRRQAVVTVHDVVSAVRATAAGRIQAAQRAMAAARQYREVVVRALAAADPQAQLSVSVPMPGARLLIVFMSEQPLCGGFNHAVIDQAVSEVRDLSRSSKVRLVAIGQRGSRLMAARGLTPEHIETGSTSLVGLRSLVRRLAGRVDHGYVAGEFAAAHAVYARYRSVSEQVPTLEQVLPFDPAIVPRSRAPKTFFRYLPAPQLIAGLISQYAYISLYRAAAESYASEQASRLIAMDGATRNTEKMADELLDLQRRERQNEITRQMLELTAARFAGETH